MALLDRFRKRERALKKAVAKPEPAKTDSSAAQAKAVPAGERKIIGIIISPHLTEKSSAGAATGWYTFRVSAGANKILIKRAVEDRYGVSVRQVRIVNQRGKAIRIGRVSGETPGFKKAMVKVRPGQSIEFQ